MIDAKLNKEDDPYENYSEKCIDWSSKRQQYGD